MERKEYYTPHIKAAVGDFAKTVLMPGDPKRSEFVAKNYLEGAVLVNDVRGIQGYTGTYKGEPVSVMASGMGIPSIGIYSYELYNFFDVDNIIRIGSAGSLQPYVKVRDIVIGMGASTSTAYGAQFGLPGSYAPISDYDLLRFAIGEADRLGAKYHVGNLLSADAFYNADPTFNERWAKMGTLAVEMEAAGLYMNAAHAGKRALAICTVSDEVFTGISTTSEERRSTFTVMIEMALETALKIKSVPLPIR